MIKADRLAVFDLVARVMTVALDLSYDVLRRGEIAGRSATGSGARFAAWNTRIAPECLSPGAGA